MLFAPVFGYTANKAGYVGMISFKGSCIVNDHKFYHTRKLNANTYAIMESLHYSSQEPIAYLLMGANRDLLIDTGQKIKNENDSKISSVVFNLIKNWHKKYRVRKHPLIVMHNHCHYDHIGGDIGFENHPGVIYLSPGLASLEHFFKFKGQPAKYNLGNREITILLSPGHTNDSLALYDAETKILFTTDMLYHGVIFVGNYKKYKSSLKEWVHFSNKHKIEHLVGNHYPYYGLSLCAKNQVYIPGTKDLFFMLNDLEKIIRHFPQKLNSNEAVANKIVLIPLNFPCKINESQYLNSMSSQARKAYLNLLNNAGNMYSKIHRN